MIDEIENWLTFKRMNEACAESTIAKYRRYIERLLDYLESSGTPLAIATSEQLQEFTGLYLHKNNLSPASRRAVVAAVKGLYEFLLKTGVISKNPAGGLIYPKKGRKIPKIMGLHNAESLLMQPDISTLIGLRDAAMIGLLLACGMRVSGLCSLNESSLYWYKYKDVDRLALKLSEKGGNERVVPVDNSAMLLVRAYLGHPHLQGIDRWLDDGDQVLFVSTRNRNIPEHEYHGENRRISRNSVLAMIKKYGEAAGIPSDQLHPHAMRHLLGTEMAESDETTLQIQTALGHADPSTSAIYVQTALRKFTEVMDRSNTLSKINTPVSPLLKELKQEGLIK